MVAIIERGTPNPHRPSLLFVHGAFHGAWAWEEHFLPYFADRGWHVQALDLREHGEKPSPERVTWLSIQDYVDDVEQVAGALPRPPVLIGHSLGGFVVQRWLEMRTAPAAVLAGSMPPTGGWRLTLRAARRSPVATARVFVTFNLLPLFGTSAAARYWFFSDATSEKEVAHYAGRLQEESFRAVLDTLVRPIRTRRVSTPLMVLGGSLDRTSTPSDQQVTGRKFHVDPVIIDGLPHDLMLDPHWEKAADAIDTWLGSLDLT